MSRVGLEERFGRLAIRALSRIRNDRLVYETGLSPITNAATSPGPFLHSAVIEERSAFGCVSSAICSATVEGDFWHERARFLERCWFALSLHSALAVRAQHRSLLGELDLAEHPAICDATQSARRAGRNRRSPELAVNTGRAQAAPWVRRWSLAVDATNRDGVA